MAGFLYFKPHHLNYVTRQDIEAWGVGHALPRQVACGICNSNTPAAAPGVVFADPQLQGDRPIKMDFAGNDPPQKWRKMPKSDLWIGYWTDALPTAAELIRTPHMPGFSVTLGNGQSWIIPLVRRYAPAEKKTVSNLPTYMECDDDGNWHNGPVLEVHAKLWEVTQPIADALLAEYVKGEPPTVTNEDIFNAITALLGANYLVGPGELSLMRAFTSEASTHAACMAACDWPTFMAWHDELEKKSDDLSPNAGLITSSGATA